MRARRCASPGAGHARQSGAADVQALHGKPGGVRQSQAIKPGVGQALWLMPWALATQPRPPGASSWCARPNPGHASAGTAHPAGKGAFCKPPPTKPGEARPRTKRAVVPRDGRDALTSKPSHTAGGHARRKGQASVASRPGARLGPSGRRHARGRLTKCPALPPCDLKAPSPTSRTIAGARQRTLRWATSKRGQQDRSAKAVPSPRRVGPASGPLRMRRTKPPDHSTSWATTPHKGKPSLQSCTQRAVMPADHVLGVHLGVPRASRLVSTGKRTGRQARLHIAEQALRCGKASTPRSCASADGDETSGWEPGSQRRSDRREGGSISHAGPALGLRARRSVVERLAKGGEGARTRPCRGAHSPGRRVLFGCVMRVVLSPKKEGARLLVYQEANLRGARLLGGAAPGRSLKAPPLAGPDSETVSGPLGQLDRRLPRSEARSKRQQRASTSSIKADVREPKVTL